MAEPQLTDARLLDRIRDLEASLPADLAFLTRAVEEKSPRPDALRDLGERLVDLGGAVLRRSEEVNAAVLATLPAHGWLPGAGPLRRAAGPAHEAGRRPAGLAHQVGPRPAGLAHQVGPRPLRCGIVFLALCGAACFPFYGKDPTDRTARHEHCPTCRARDATVTLPDGATAGQ
ncbi:hypothetical protein [Amycolatopsis saalfeldensis]|uniref:Uncharacterized protein n=1 Tax=Amycolatopsis saalfeldensis TaxID=394193 RepID=A0A1H8Y287_9PSEU|nr:hypothetical protein [Amycolatopsis saalfeldensis]SEP46113.1 hypothetical protein SAMN04489732_110182 [Amycolatopsis saalfeldensis]